MADRPLRPAGRGHAADGLQAPWHRAAPAWPRDCDRANLPALGHVSAHRPAARRLRVPLALLGLALVFCEGIREDELHCEESAARLVRCCPGFETGSLSCEAQGCGSPGMTDDEARCIRDRSCEELRAGGTCARAIAAWTTGSSFGTDDRPVCR